MNDAQFQIMLYYLRTNDKLIEGNVIMAVDAYLKPEYTSLVYTGFLYIIPP